MRPDMQVEGYFKYKNGHSDQQECQINQYNTSASCNSKQYFSAMSNCWQFQGRISNKIYIQIFIVNFFVLLGDESVGKTSLITRFVFDAFLKNISLLLVQTSFLKPLKYRINLFFCNCGIMPGKRNINPQFPIQQEIQMLLSFVMISLVINNIISKKDENSFKNISMWIEIIKKENRKEILTFVFGNKSDLQQKRKIDSNQTKLLNLSLDTLQHFEVSARCGYNLNDVFQKIAKDLLDQNSKKQESKENIESLFSPEQGYNQPNSFC